ncbi:MAG: hypothetical protein Q4A75_06105 [Peptostreptococcaceae bacterium]|nr:hypothetical protein [Peptostreptococcaceae bacterium]
MKKLDLENSTGGFLKGLFGGDKVTSVALTDGGLELETKKEGKVNIPFASIDKIGVRGYFEPDPVMMFITLLTKDKKYTFELPNDGRDTDLLLEHFSNYQLGADFPQNLDQITLDVGSVVPGVSFKISGGKFIRGSKEKPFAYDMKNLESFELNRSFYQYQAKFSDDKTKFMVSSEQASNIVSIMKVMNAYLKMS